jgi:GNAT superfamily N-acetyltransferase
MIDLSIVAVPVSSAEAVMLMAELDAEMGRRYPGVAPHGLHAKDLADPRTVFLVGRVGGDAVACGALRAIERGVAEIKRMYVRQAFQRRGIGRRVLVALESRARDAGFVRICLETGVGQPEAIALYRSAGFVAIEPYGEYVGDSYSRCFEKQLTNPEPQTPNPEP